MNTKQRRELTWAEVEAWLAVDIESPEHDNKGTQSDFWVKEEQFVGDNYYMPCVEYIRQLEKEGKTAYLSVVSEKMLDELGQEKTKLNIRKMDSVAYNSNAYAREQAERELDAKMAEDGWQRLDTIGDYRGSAYLRAKREVDWLTQNIDIEGKIITDSGGRPFFIPKGRRSRGYNLVGTLKGYWKIK